jgi:hypothetical protein
LVRLMIHYIKMIYYTINEADGSGMREA